MTDQEIENAIKAKGADVAPRVTLADIEGAIVAEHYFTALDGVEGAWKAIDSGIVDDTDKVDATADPSMTRVALSLLTFCILVLRNDFTVTGESAAAGAGRRSPARALRNGFTVTGESACVSAENFDADLGRKRARQNAIDKCWPLFGFALADRLAREEA